MKKIRCLSLLILMALVAYILCEEAGIVKTFNQKYPTEEVIWTKLKL